MNISTDMSGEREPGLGHGLGLSMYFLELPWLDRISVIRSGVSVVVYIYVRKQYSRKGDFLVLRT